MMQSMIYLLWWPGFCTWGTLLLWSGATTPFLKMMDVSLGHHTNAFITCDCIVLQFPAFLLGVEPDALKEKLIRWELTV